MVNDKPAPNVRRTVVAARPLIRSYKIVSEFYGRFNRGLEKQDFPEVELSLEEFKRGKSLILKVLGSRGKKMTPWQ